MQHHAEDRKKKNLKKTVGWCLIREQNWTQLMNINIQKVSIVSLAQHPELCVISALWEFWKVVFPMPVCWEGQLGEIRDELYHRQGLGVQHSTPPAAFSTHTVCAFPSLTQQTGRNQKTGLGGWPQTAPLPLCSDKLPSSNHQAFRLEKQKKEKGASTGNDYTHTFWL